MKTKVANPRRLDILGNGDSSSNQEILTVMLKQWCQKLGYCSIFAAVPSILVSHVQKARTGDAKKPETSVAGEGTRLLERLNLSFSNPALLKRQSEFRLPHQKDSFDMVTTIAGKDDCPGHTIPGGNYTGAAPYIDFGDTTGANDTVTRAYYINYVYYNYDAFGPDHVYSFTLTGRGPNPQIEVSTTSSTYRPLIYVLHGGAGGGCPAGTGNHAMNELVLNDSRWSTGRTATLGNWAMNSPLNVPLHLFVDSADVNSFGPYTIRMQDVTIAPAACPSPNPIDCPEFFVRQHYLDFLNREPDQQGWDYWTNEISSCGADQLCVNARRIRVSDAFFFEPEFQQTGSYVFRLYRASYADNQPFPNPDADSRVPGLNLKLPSYAVFNQDREQVVGGANLAQAQLDLANAFVQRPEFIARYPAGLSSQEFVNAVLANIQSAEPGVDLSSQQSVLLALYNQGGRGAVMYRLADDNTQTNPVNNRAFIDAEYNLSFVAVEYFGYLRRDADTFGLNFWLDQVNRFPLRDISIQHAMVCSFITSAEYQLRFGSVVTRTNAECPQ
jgi:hypothetical protein